MTTEGAGTSAHEHLAPKIKEYRCTNPWCGYAGPRSEVRVVPIFLPDGRFMSELTLWSRCPDCGEPVMSGTWKEVWRAQAEWCKKRNRWTTRRPISCRPIKVKR